LAAAFGSAANAQTLSRNLTEAYAPVKARMLAGGGEILCIGDSLTARPGGFHDNFKTMVQQRYGDGGFGWQGASIWTGWLPLTPGWAGGLNGGDPAPYRGIDGFWISWQNQPVNASGRFLAQNRSVRVFYVREPMGADIIVSGGDILGQGNIITGSIRLPTNSQFPDVREYADYFPSPNPADWHLTFRAGGNGTQIHILGQINSSDSPGPRVHRAANGGWGVNSFIRRDFTFDAVLRAIDPDLILIMLGQNDGFMPGPVFRERMEILLNRLQAQTPRARIVLVASYNSGGQNLDAFANELDQLAEDRGLGFINLYAAGGPPEFFESAGFIDGIPHHTPEGGRYISRIIFNALESGGATLSTCADTDFNNDGVSPDTADIDDFISVFGGGACSTSDCDPIDANRDGVSPDIADIEVFLGVFAGGQCP
jgi:hypothetical protein